MISRISLFFAAALMTWSSAGAQEVKRPPLRVPPVTDAVARFVPSGWRLETDKVREADLNGDGRPDAAFVISNGGTAEDSAVVKHVLVLALRGDDGKLHRSIVNDAAVLDGDEGGVFGDPFEDLTVERGAVVITHYGGSRDRWGFTHRYRFQNGEWKLIGLTIGSTDTLNLEHYDNQDINLSTGLVEASEKGGDDGEPQKRETSGSYYELEVAPANAAPAVDGRAAVGEWPGYSVLLNDKAQVIRNRRFWKGPDDLSVRLHALRLGDNLFICAEVTDDEVTAGDTVSLLTRRGLKIRPRESKKVASEKGYIFEARYSLTEIARAAKPDDKYIAENLAMMLDPASEYGDTQGFQLPVSIEIIDRDKQKYRAVFSTHISGSPYPGAIRIFRQGTLTLSSDVEQ